MSVRRHFRVIENDATAHDEAATRIAFASGDMAHVDQHFGTAQNFAVYEISPTFDRLVEVVRFAASDRDGNEDKLMAKIEALEGCAAVYVQAVGGSAIRQLLRLGVCPVKTPAGTPISALIAQARAEMRTETAPWVHGALRPRKDPERFAAMAEEIWDE